MGGGPVPGFDRCSVGDCERSEPRGRSGIYCAAGGAGGDGVGGDGAAGEGVGWVVDRSGLSAASPRWLIFKRHLGGFLPGINPRPTTLCPSRMFAYGWRCATGAVRWRWGWWRCCREAVRPVRLSGGAGEGGGGEGDGAGRGLRLRWRFALRAGVRAEQTVWGEQGWGNWTVSGCWGIFQDGSDIGC